MKNMSSDIVEQFTRAMVDLSKSNQTSGPVTVPGTIVSIGGSAYQVLLDGSTVYTPAESTVAYASGDRVSVSLADHKATIVGNYTDQSVGGTAAYNAGYSGGGAAGTAAATIYLLGDGQLVIGTAATNAANNYITTGDGAGIISNAATTAGSSAGSTAGATAGASAGQSAANSYITSGAGATIIIDTASTAGSSAGATAGATAGQTAANDYITTGAGVTIISNAATTAGSAAGQQYIQANLANIEHIIAGDITADSGFISTLTSNVINASDVYADMVKSAQIITDFLTADSADIDTIISNHISAEEIEAKQAWVESLEAAFATIVDLKASFADIGFANVDVATINRAMIEDLFSRYASFEAVDAKIATIQKLIADTGYITEFESVEGVVTKRLTAVEIDATNIVAGVLQAERILLKGDDGLYHYLNSGVIPEWVASKPYNLFDRVRHNNLVWISAHYYNIHNEPGITGWVSDNDVQNWEQPSSAELAYANGDVIRYQNKLWLSTSDNNMDEPTDQSSLWETDGIELAPNVTAAGLFIDGLDGDTLIAKSVTADKISVTDLHAFNATIGGLEIDSYSMHSIEKSSVASNANGFYVDRFGQFSIGSGLNYIRYYTNTTTVVDQVVLGQMSYVSGQSYLSQAGNTWFSNVVGRGADTSITSSTTYNSSSSYTPVVIKYELQSSVPTIANLSRAYISINCRSVTLGEMIPDDPNYYLPEDIHFKIKNSSGTILGSALSTNAGYQFIGDGGEYITYDHVETIELPTLTMDDLDGLYLECIIPNAGGVLNGATLYLEYQVPDPMQSNWNLDVNFTNFEEFENDRVTQSHYIRFNDLSTLANATNHVAVSIGSDMVDDKYILEIDNESGIKYVHSGDSEPVSYWDRDIFVSGNLEVKVTKRAQFGNFAFIPRSDGSLMLLKVK